ncbi:MAG: hypothetical protein ABIP48_17560 [Planctomycetota bacterium]
MGDDADKSGVRCAACNRRLTSDRPVQLWDGRVYCRACVERAFPGLAEYAALHDRLEETMPLEFCREHRKGLILFLASIIGFFELFVVAMGLSGEEGALLGALLATLAMVLAYVPIFLLFYYALWRNVRNNLPRVCAQSGRLIVWYGESQRNVALRDCQWWFGKLNGMHLWRKYLIFSRAPVVLIRLPPGGFWGRSPITVAVGYTTETRKLWDAFLRLARVPKRR